MNQTKLLKEINNKLDTLIELTSDLLDLEVLKIKPELAQKLSAERKARKAARKPSRQEG